MSTMDISVTVGTTTTENLAMESHVFPPTALQQCLLLPAELVPYFTVLTVQMYHHFINFMFYTFNNVEHINRSFS